MEEQHYKNHSRYIPLYHLVTFGLVGAIMATSLMKLYKSYMYNIHWIWLPALFTAISIVLLLVTWYTRSFALKAQDRAIRAEENLRYFAMTGTLLDSKLTIKQIVALRFASNNELLDLAHRAVKENMKPADIKRAIKHWKEDHDRV
jgi:hypothetical protein